MPEIKETKIFKQDRCKCPYCNTNHPISKHDLTEDFTYCDNCGEKYKVVNPDGHTV